MAELLCKEECEHMEKAKFCISLELKTRDCIDFFFQTKVDKSYLCLKKWLNLAQMLMRLVYAVFCLLVHFDSTCRSWLGDL